MNNLNSETLAGAKPSHEQVALRAELLWKAKGTPTGQDEQIWLEAERQLFDEAKEMIGTSSEVSSPSNQPSGKSSAAERMTKSSSTGAISGKKRSGGK